jgi:hypothetical protein
MFAPGTVSAAPPVKSGFHLFPKSCIFQQEIGKTSRKKLSKNSLKIPRSKEANSPASNETSGSSGRFRSVSGNVAVWKATMKA